MAELTAPCEQAHVFFPPRVAWDRGAVCLLSARPFPRGAQSARKASGSAAFAEGIGGRSKINPTPLQGSGVGLVGLDQCLSLYAAA